jgi:hypothetical protein
MVKTPEPISRQLIGSEFTFDCIEMFEMTACEVPCVGRKVMQGAFAGATISTPEPGPRSPWMKIDFVSVTLSL